YLFEQSGITLHRIRDLTRPPIDIETRRLADDFIGDLLKLTDSMKRDPGLLEQIREPLQELYEKLARKKLAAPPDNDTLLAILEEAETLCLDHLIGDRE
ncbi:hypothetical protein ACFL6I_09485, partial [candidate division KSB1 bacterium]